MRRVWSPLLVVLALLLALLYTTVPLSQTQDQGEDLRYSYRYGCPLPENYNYCPARYESLSTNKRVYRRGEEVELTLSNLEDFEYLVEKVEVYFKPLFEQEFNLYYKQEEVGPIAREKDEWVWVWDQKNADGEQVGAGRFYIRITLNCCRNYRTYFRISQQGGGGEFSLPDQTEEETGMAPSRPGNFDYKIISPTEVELTWRDNSDDEDGFRVYRNGEQVATLGPNSTSYTDTNVRKGESYNYRVASFNQSGESSTSRSLTVNLPVEVSNAPGGLSSRVLSPTKIRLTWDDNSDNEEGFRIYRNGNRVSTVGPNSTKFVHKGLQGETRYCYEVVAYNRSGESGSTNRNCAMTLTSMPGSPGNVNASPISSSEIRLTWNDTSDNEDGFRVYRNGVEIANLGPNTTSYIDTGLNPNSSYSYEVSAYNNSGESGLSSSGTVTTPGAAEPQPEPQPEPKEDGTSIGQTELIAGIGIVLMVMGYIYAEMG